MEELVVSSLSIEAVLSQLRSRDWLIPQFQRDFVWEVNDVVALVTSIFEGRPIGMATLWNQAPDSILSLEPISIPDTPDIKYFSETNNTPKLVNAIIDGKQRCTAIAMAFGGFRPDNNRRKYAGRYYLLINDTLDSGWEVVYYKETDVRRNNLDKNAVCFAKGIFPLHNEEPGKNFVSQWMNYLSVIDDKSIYNDKYPSEEIRQNRKQIIQSVFSGLISTKLAIFTLPIRYTLAEICDIFQTLNTTGTNVSTVDLIHSWLYNESIQNQSQNPLLLRDWLDDLGSYEGAVGWASKSNRPELTVQIVTACYICLDNPPKPRRVGKSNKKSVSSLKSEDLLATPLEHWETIIDNEQLIANYLGEFQILVAGGYFPFTQCPYPISSAIYVGLRWHHKFENPNWSVADLNAVYSAFFWRNSLSLRYDQGFLTKIGSDIKELKLWLLQRINYDSSSSWAEAIQEKFELWFKDSPKPDQKSLIDLLTDKRPSGALYNAFTLLMYTQVKKDIVDSKMDISYPSGDQKSEFHHIYPKKWCSDNVYGSLKTFLDKETAGRDYVDSISNLMPLSRKSNSEWKTKIPSQFLDQKNISYNSMKEIFAKMYIDEKEFNYLKSNNPSPGEFWIHRAKLISDVLLDKMNISFK